MPEIEEQQIKDWRPINLSFAQAKYPQPENPHLPRHCFVACVAGARNSGKTFSVCQWIKQMEQTGVKSHDGTRAPIRTIVISPTASLNPVFTSLHSLDADDIHLEYTDELMYDIIEDIKETRRQAEEYQEKVALWNKLLKMRDLNDLTFEELMTLNFQDFQPPSPPRYEVPPITNLILDDLVGSQALRQGRSPITNLILRNRHHLTNVFICSQAIRQVPKAIRNNANVYMVFKYANSKMINDDLYPEVSNVLTEDEFGTLYEHATEGAEYPFLFVDFTKPKEDYFRKGFHTYLRLKK